MEKSFGKYTLLERLGGGGMAEVFKARLRGPAGFEKLLALKLILPHYSDDPEFVRMFIHEATLVAKLDHANIVRIHEFDRVEERYYIAMELVDGRDLRQVLARSSAHQRPFTVAEALIVVVEICRGLAFAHGELTKGAVEVVHRDISPHNVILSRAGEVKITDFGIAKLASGASQTRTGVVKGKLAYMSPEQVRAEALDRRSDLFSTGCVLWELLCGRRLFAGPNEAATVENLKSAPIRPPSEFNSQVSEDLDRSVLRALSRDVNDRFAMASEMGRALETALASCAGVDRTSALAVLFEDLFGEDPDRPKTGVLPAGPGTGPEPPTRAVGELAQSENQPSVSGPTTEPIGLPPERPPEPPTVAVLAPETAAAEPEEAVEAVVPTDGELGVVPAGKPGRSSRLMWLGLLMVTPLVAALGYALVGWLASNGTESARSAMAPVPDAGAPTVALPDSQPDGVPSGPDPVAEGDHRTGDQEGPSAPVVLAGQADSVTSAALPPVASNPVPVRRSMGRLRLNVIPWAKVFRGNKLLGTTPLEDIPLPVGRHTLVLVNEDLKARRTIRVRVRPGKTTSHLENLTTP